MKDDALLKLIKKNPEQGIHELMNLYGGAVGTICKNFLRDFPENDIEEAIADTFIHFWKSSGKFHLKSGHSLKSYLYAIARNVARDKRRQAKVADIYSLEELSLELPDDYDLENEFVRRQNEATLHTCLREMKEPDKSIFLYRYFYGFSRKEIAGKFALSVKQVENILYRGKERLRRDLTERRFTRE